MPRQVYNNNRDWENGYRQHGGSNQCNHAAEREDCTGSCNWNYVKKRSRYWEANRPLSIHRPDPPIWCRGLLRMCSLVSLAPTPEVPAGA